MRTLLRAAIVAAALPIFAAAPAYAEGTSVSGCKSVGLTPVAETTVCAFDTATVYYDDEPIRRSFLSCLYGTPIDWEGVDASAGTVDPSASYQVLGSSGTVDPELSVTGIAYSTGYVEGGPDLGGGCV